MSKHIVWQYPDVPEIIEKLLLNDEKRKIVVIGVIGKSAFPDCNKMACMDILDRHPELIEHEPSEGQIQFYYKPFESILWIHFETTYDAYCMQKLLIEELQQQKFDQFLSFHHKIKNRFARMFLLATQICHIIVFVETNVTFDTSLVPIFKSLKIIRDQYISKFLPKMIKNSLGTNSLLDKKSRICTPRIIFCFENLSKGYEKTSEALSKLEIDQENNIYKLMRNEHIIHNYNNSSLFLLSKNQRFVYFNLNNELRKDPLEKSMQLLHELLDKPNGFLQDDEELQELLPFEDFGKPIVLDQQKYLTKTQQKSFSPTDFYQKYNFMEFIQTYIDEALNDNTGDITTKHKTNNCYMKTTATQWFQLFHLLYKIFIVNPDTKDFQTNDIDYKSYLENFDSTLNFDNKFFQACCDQGLEKAFAMYNNPKLSYYSAEVHNNMIEESVLIYRKYARGPQKSVNEQCLREMCEACWKNEGKQQCEYPSLRGEPCVRPKHYPQDINEHSSGVVYISACNCGHTQGRRDDPYSVQHANYEFYAYMANNCTLCGKVKRIHFPIFQPSINNYRAAEFNGKYSKKVPTQRQKIRDYKNWDNNRISDDEDNNIDENEVNGSVDVDDINSGNQLAISQDSHTNLSLSTESIDRDGLSKLQQQQNNELNLSSNESFNELILEVKNSCINGKKDLIANDPSSDECPTNVIENINNIITNAASVENTIKKHRPLQQQPSTTEYLPGMVHTESPTGLLPQFPSWSLCCVGASSIYSHANGLMEHFQCGFLAGTNFLLPWDVHVRFEHSISWITYKKGRCRKIGDDFVIKIFIGFEYECPNGHRFMMTSPDNILGGTTGSLQRNSASKVVYNNMPLYYPCPCSVAKKQFVAQLMRIHVVTPKAPVHIMLDPKVRIGDYIFTSGLSEPPKLSQSAYWILRLPYIYQGDEEIISPPKHVTSNNAQEHGCLLTGMFGVSEMEYEE